MRNYRARQAAGSARRWVKMAAWCRERGDRGGAALALEVAARFRRYAAWLLEQDRRDR